ncbi:MAG: hypothetical protein R3245_03570, partial [Kiloniellales bacterium]|nr:hypothetical protein [Kiloniellales bacterium]
MRKEAKIPQLATGLANSDGCGEKKSTNSSKEEAAALVEDFVTERGIAALEKLLRLAESNRKGAARTATALAEKLPGDTRLLEAEVG